MRNLRIFLLILIIIGIGLLLTQKIWVPKLVDNIINSENARSGVTGNGKISYINAGADMIVVDLPQPDAVVGKDFSITGKARGPWFFEASFPIQILSADGKVLASTPAQATGEPGAWMTENFVPFKADIHLTNSYTGLATVVLKKDNPSGIPSKDAAILFPITVKY